MVEAIAAMSILLLVMVASTPPIITAIVTLIQSRRVSQATQLAQLEIDKIRELFSIGGYASTDLPPSAATTVTRATLQTVAAPSAICTTFCTITQGRIVYLADQQFLVQTFRTVGVNWSDIDPSRPPNIPIAFRMAVRIYSGTAITNLGGLTNTQDGSSIGLSSNEKSQAQAPLVVLYVDFVRGDLNASQQAYQLFLN